MDMYLISLPAEVGQFLMRNIAVVEVIAMFSIGAYNALEVGIATFDCFKHYCGLYFWSMQVASRGILVHAIPAQIRYLSQAPNLPMAIPFIVGWYAMVTGQAVVLYSRLHLVVTDMRHLYWVLWMIIGNFFVLQVPMTVLFFEVDLGNGRLARAAAIYDRIQLLGFCLQDSIISGIYIREALRALQPVFEIRGRDGRKVIINLIAINGDNEHFAHSDRVQSTFYPNQLQDSGLQHQAQARIQRSHTSSLPHSNIPLHLPKSTRQSTSIERY